MRRWSCLVVLAAIVISSRAAFAVSPSQSDNFQDGADGWTDGHLLDAEVVANGGPTGIGDQYILLDELHSAILNRSQWIGNYTGIPSITMELKNSATGAVPMRVALRQSPTFATGPAYVTTTPVSLPNDGQWHLVTFNLNAGSMTGVNSPSAFSTFITNVQELRVLAATEVTYVADGSIGSIGMDNIRVPEPSALALTAVAAAFGLRRRRSRAG